MDLSKAFDCLSHELLIAKMAAYGIGKHSLNLLLSYLRSRKQRVRIGSSLSEWLEVVLGVKNYEDIFLEILGKKGHYT